MSDNDWKATNHEIERRIVALDAEAAVSDPGQEKAARAYGLAQRLSKRTGEAAIDILARLTPFNVEA